jgi:restriction system protein
VIQKARLKGEEWSARWTQVQAKEAQRRDRQATLDKKEACKAEAAERTSDATDNLRALEGLLHATLSVDDTVDWRELEDHRSYDIPAPTEPGTPGGPSLSRNPEEPARSSPAFRADINLLDKLFRSRGDRKRAQATAKFERAVQQWEAECARIESENTATVDGHEAATRTWEVARAQWESSQAENNAAVQKERDLYQEGAPDAVEEYCDLVLSRSSYPDGLSLEYEVQYLDDTRTAIVEVQLPAVDDMPTLREVKYIQSREEFDEKYLSEGQTKKLYDAVLYQVCLRTLHELFEADAIDAIDAIALNGSVTSIDRATGKSVTACILSIQVNKTEFEDINLEAVDAKACFKNLKGVGSSKLHSLTPIAPIMQFRREDGRFVSAREVVGSLDDSVNLAAMDWEDFEHLIRELFEQEFKTAGGEVSVTQASRDGGVDAIAYDPDPIRGGKIVIQAKRYTNTVGVAAVRDLYGTVMNEGATKGILVTTSDYGPDAYNFVKDKPLTLLSGSNLLHLLGKHGHRAKIDIKAARELLRE